MAAAAYPAPPAGPRPVRRLTRPSQGRLVAGVCQGLAEHLRIDVVAVRVALLVLTVAGGAGIAMYAAFWVLTPEDAPAGSRRDALLGPRRIGYVVAAAAIALAALTFGGVLGVRVSDLLLPVSVAGIGAVVLWHQLDDAQRSRWRAATGPDQALSAVRTAAGVLLVVAGSVVVVTRGEEFRQVAQVGLAALVAVAGLALVTAPWWVRMGRELAAERAARIRQQERAEIAAHVHDSVLHTLALLQRHHDDPREVSRLARAQERELRSWLYRAPEPQYGTLRVGLEQVAAEVEDAHGVQVEVVVVGDCPLDEPLRALLQAAREALVNAAKYAPGSPVALYAEVESSAVGVYVRDRGPGFEVDDIPADRLGVRQSIIGRMARNGGRASVRPAPGGGTEVALELPRTPAAPPQQQTGERP